MLLAGMIGAAIGAMIAILVVSFVRTEMQNPVAPAPRREPAQATIDPNAEYSAAKKLVAEVINERYGYNPEVGCPEKVESRKGTIFTCEALVPERGLIPVKLEVFSKVGGFIQVIGVGGGEVANGSESEYQWCKTHGFLDGHIVCEAAYQVAHEELR